ncbi:MAG: integrase arm-type DNA-binding domain-containing protein [Maritimibacter sp.]|nr:integrase arm-type DNA-binding domain-containing protein [Maritimibacter sp.]
MPKIVRAMTATEVKHLRHPGHAGNAKFAVGGEPGLLLQITATGAKSWLLRASIGGRRRAIGLGTYPSVSLGDARQKAREAQDLIRQGIDPIEERKAARAAQAAAQVRVLTFDEATERYLSTKLDEFKNARHRQTWGSSLRTHASPELGATAVADIGVGDVLRVLQPIWKTRTETALRLRGRIEKVLDWAKVAGYREGENPARWRGNLDALLPAPSKIKAAAHQPAISLDDAPAWFSALRGRQGMAARALEFVAMTAVRSGEARGAKWDEVDLDKGIWIVPAARTKTAKEHRVPLSDPAIELLKSVPRMAGSKFIFTAPQGGELSDMSVSAVMRRMQKAEEDADRAGWVDARSGRPAVPHGLRSTFRDWAAETGVERDLAELALGHLVGSEVERAYRRTDLFERRRAVMGQWADFLAGRHAAGQVVPLHGGARS